MAGYEAPSTTVKLVFDGGRHDGLIVRAKSVPMGEFLRLTEIAASKDNAEELDPHEFSELTGAFAEALTSWNLTIGGEPVSADLAGVARLEAPFAMELIMTWLGSIGDVGASLGKASPSGATSLEASLPMEPLSASLAS